MKSALLQLNVGDDPAANLIETTALLRAAVADGAQFVLTPEVTNCISTNRDRQRAVLQDEASDITLAGLRAEAVTLGIWLLIGSLAVKTDDPDGRFANRQFLIGPDGGIRARYDKIHMFDVQIAEGETYRESAGYRPGRRAVVADLPELRLGMAICYDMRFGHLSRALVQAGAQVLVYPSAFSPVTGAAHWHSLLRARAIESGAWVLAPAQTGTHRATSGPQRSTFGHSLVIDPWGDVVVDAGTDPGFRVFDLEIDRVADARRRIPALENAREFDGP
ncbi:MULTISPECIES: carbon-nitrogen hydrolase family protein [Roseobacteraceae]|jgi:predicted amidohydrolase|uniref:Hydrolase n=1 Tax=Pseudosulfitobacter pseudonitzschiae TaxID=1402135 RepID=A0A221K4T9_9RHOB|nr:MULTISPECIES: carbon-nitrogen hydrolase family protein [Roseobacteraceae]ASM73900.1 hydrolase [Pseudosulfitobacter pseudonitzschiae]